MRNRFIERWMLLLMAMLLMACGGSEEENSSIPEDEDCYLDIYVYAPDRPIVTRADVGEIEARTKEESEVHTLQIWVFKNSDGSKVGYLEAGEDGISEPFVLNETGQQVYRMKVDKSFANTPEAVDVYVVANAASFGNAIYVPHQESYTSTTLDGNTTRAKLNDAMIGSAYFGTTNLYGIADLATGEQKGRITENGLPMSAVLKNQPISGKFPTLRIGTESQIATLHLTRAVSKLRFVLCRVDDASSTKKLVSIDGIKLDGGQIPTMTYLMPGAYNYPGSSFVSDATDVITYVPSVDGKIEKLVPEAVTEHPELVPIPIVTNPLDYAYEGQNEKKTAQKYEDMINNAIENGDLKELGLTYLRESDKQLKGTITYTYTDNGDTKDDQTPTFLMAAPGDFLRNHSWIIYIYYLDSKIYTLTVTNIGMREWETDPLGESATVYNW